MSFDARGLAVLACLLLAHCGTYGGNERLVQINTDVRAAKDRCEARYPPPRKDQQISWAACVNAAERPALSITLFPDLLERKFANRLELAAKIDQADITFEELVLLAAKLNSSVMTEAERRLKTMAQETVEAAYRYPPSRSARVFRVGNAETINVS
jgi:hypothetical protein